MSDCCKAENVHLQTFSKEVEHAMCCHRDELLSVARSVCQCTHKLGTTNQLQVDI
ncbi:hypothetical protein SERLA73DRAFT_133985 [Serpula lacrymans var. lacrymans S7.3]|uniref:Uncharacterized protein n=1 Tax=Serpula lacrymans var. lacrymans (strain S7.3) TaxID=936435 RepID=F8PT57_SERL3|nr:hypothetical protein SERLA73DRAFT_133985 [Serpula lacrymans var. lacrymans S7.3]